MNGPTRRLAVAMFTAFAVLLGALTWFQVVGSDRYRLDPRNARPSINLSGKERGLIVAGDGAILAQSVADQAEGQSFTRVYPGGPAFTHAVGYTSRLVGSAGLEAAYAEELRSRRDLTISDLIAVLFGRDLRPSNLQVTIDPVLQRTAYEALGGNRGAAVALDPQSGAVLAYVSSPSYDPSPFLGEDAVAAREAVLADPLEPVRDRAGREIYAPGSTFKTIVAAAAFEAGVAGPESEFVDQAAFPLPGSTATIRNFDGGTCGSGQVVTLQRAFVQSCNTVFAALSIETGAAEIDRTATAAGFNRQLEFAWDLAQSVFPGAALANDPAALAQSGIGQRDVRSTPLVMALVAAAVANGGEAMRPQIVRQIFDNDGEAIRVMRPEALGRVMSPAGAAVLSQMMERVVTEGTGRRAAVAGVRVAGKTGTAESPDGPPDLWFIGFAPVDDPTIALAVLVEEGGPVGESATGGSVAAPIGAQMFRAWLER